jgi:hypothetical protein
VLSAHGTGCAWSATTSIHRGCSTARSRTVQPGYGPTGVHPHYALVPLSPCPTSPSPTTLRVSPEGAALSRRGMDAHAHSVRCHPWCLPRALISMVRGAWCAPMSSAARCRMLAGQYDRIREGTVSTRAGTSCTHPRPTSSPTTTARARRGSSSGGGGGEAERCNAARTLHRAPWVQHAVQHATSSTTRRRNATRTAAHIPHRIAWQTVHH